MLAQIDKMDSKNKEIKAGIEGALTKLKKLIADADDSDKVEEYVMDITKDLSKFKSDKK